MSANAPDPKNPLATGGVWGAVGMVLIALLFAAQTVVTKDGFSLKTGGQQLAGIGIVIVLALAVALVWKTLSRPDVKSGIPFLDRNNDPAPLPPSATREAAKREEP